MLDYNCCVRSPISMHCRSHGFDSTFRVSCPDRTLQSVIVKGYRHMHGDVILVGKFDQMV